MGIAEALSTMCEDSEHSTRHWVQLVAIANGSKRNRRDGGKTGTGSSTVEDCCPSASLTSRRRSRSHGEAHPRNWPSLLHHEKLQARTRGEGVRARALGEEGVWDEGRQRAFQQLQALKFPAAATVLVSSVLIRCLSALRSREQTHRSASCPNTNSPRA